MEIVVVVVDVAVVVFLVGLLQLLCPLLLIPCGVSADIV